jgi:hypothetical protein
LPDDATHPALVQTTGSTRNLPNCGEDHRIFSPVYQFCLPDLLSGSKISVF